MGLRNTVTFLIGFGVLFSCQSTNKEEKDTLEIKNQREEFFVVPGEDEPVDSIQVKSGKVLISYSDCYECHKLDQDATGPSFSDIARRYPSNQIYIDFLARKVINGGSGTWGAPVMRSHPKLAHSDAKQMVTYILSLDIL